MNGRVQDAILGRFLSPDPLIQDPSNAQNYNRYTYVLNNPLTFIDPTGFDNCENTGGQTLAPNCDDSGQGGGGADTPTGVPGQTYTDKGPGGIPTITGTGNRGTDDDDDDAPPPVLPDNFSKCLQSIVFCVSTAQSPKPKPNPIKSFLCQNSGSDSLAQQAADTAGNAGTAADSVRPVVAIGVAAAGTSNVANPLATSFLGSQAVSALSAIGRIGQGASITGILYAGLTGDYQSALYGTADYFAYSALSDFGAASAIPTAGLGTAAAAGIGLLYYNAGGSQGLVQGAICP